MRSRERKRHLFLFCGSGSATEKSFSPQATFGSTDDKLAVSVSQPELRDGLTLRICMCDLLKGTNTQDFASMHQ